MMAELGERDRSGRKVNSEVERTSVTRLKGRWPYRLAFIGLGVAVCALVLWQTAHWTREIAMQQIMDRSRPTLNLVVENLRGELGKYNYQPQLLASHPAFPAALKGQASARDVLVISKELEQINSVIGSLDTYLMNRDGLTIAASNWASPRTFVGKNFHYRPYFQSAMQGRLGRYFALGTTSGERGYYFAYPVREGQAILGAVVVKMSVGHHEGAWRAPSHEIIVVDQSGVVFLSSKPDWQFRTLAPLTDAQRADLRDSRKYGDQPLRPLAIAERAVASDGAELVKILTDNGPGGRVQNALKQPEAFLMHTADMADAGWRVMLLARTSEVGDRVNVAVAVAGFMLVSLLLATANLYQRRRRLADHLAMQEQAKADLEMRVDERTNELTQANITLRKEVAERKRAEEELRRAQANLVQATKLAALGEMSAGLSHELNQPLAAIRSYADNARAFLERNRADTVKTNLGGIAELTDRMARIIKNLRTYARDENIDTRPTSVNAAVVESLTLLDARIRRDGVTVHTDLPPGDIRVIAGDVRLQQVFVNLLTNAIDAMDGRAEKAVYVAVRRDADTVVATVRDIGPGIAADKLNSVFDPFYSTKDVGQGLGLGLSITYGLVNQFGGSIEVENHPDGGAVFTVTLVATESTRDEVA